MVGHEELPERSRVVQQHLLDAGLDVRVRELPASTRTAAEAAAALGCAVGAIASSLLFMADGEPLLVMTSGRHRVDVDLVAGQVGAGSVVMATAAQVREVTGQAIGGVAPVGHPAPVRTVVDRALREHATVWVAGGTPRTIVPLTVDQLVALTDARELAVASD
ncbi:YbaK/EbsC family protein [Microlunatus flavus]|uniref:Cys-tRNA(Pro) deacylase, prolyl-tRNA editing enzyme YbaK/EbsC n=1 Tax=Microlunatus flavus TaxID=1036181 RepID=A0A1H9J0M4_9ACTN|nr:YbaK/EbsC family protein [Microlunatus flavus]SEQ80601.1 Cys-tRNA(Pro) deacylase, prolyl-tRNA editing enzyme YbaK/EbsC [Microlunatus flavus]